MVSEAELESGAVTKRNIEIIKGDRCHIWDQNGKKYLDMGASYGVCNVGHCNPKVIEAIRRQMEDILYVSSSYDNPARKAIMEKLISVSPPGMSRVFLCNSGTEANEAALKFALKHTGRKKLVAAKRAFHGRTLGSLALTFNPSHREGVEDKLYPVDFVNFGSAEDLSKAVSEETAAVVLEPIQGEGGVHIPPEGYLREARRICDEKGALLIMDEVQTGLCRTGRMFATEYDGISPDILTVGKSLGGGLPIAAAVLNKKMGEVPKGSHGSTFGGNPLACAGGKAALDFMTDEGLDRCAAEKGERFINGLKGINDQQIREIRGRGLMIGLELKTRSGPFLTSLLDRGITAVPTGATVIRFLPPLVISDTEIDHAIDTITEVLHNGKSG
jgi:acetylornithine/LysW-gamma-L-lysine aminotransferase